MVIVKYLAAVLLFIVTLIVGTILMDSVIIPQMAFTDSLSVHSGCTAFFNGISPYEESVTLRTQQTISRYSPSYDPANDPHRFVYPTHTCLLLFPLWTVSYDTMAPAWMFLNFVLFTLLPISFLVFVTRYRIPILQGIALTFLGIFFSRYSMITVIFAQYVGWVLLCLVFAIWALMNRRKTLLAVSLVGLTIRPGGAFFAVLLLLYTLFEGHYRTIFVFISIMLVLWLISLMMVGPWITDFLSGIFTYTTYREDVRWLPLRIGLFPGIAYLIGMGTVASVIIYQARQKDRETFIVWAMITVVMLELVLFPQTNSYTLVYMLPAMLLVAYAFRNNTIAFWCATFYMGLVPWIWLFGIEDISSPNLDQLFMPASIMLILAIAWIYGDVTILPETEDKAF